MKKKEFLLRLKLQKGVGYVKLLTITNQMKPGLEIEIDDPDTIKKVLSELEKQFNFTANKENTNQSKVQRAWEHKK